jgi:hypothetical protein
MAGARGIRRASAAGLLIEVYGTDLCRIASELDKVAIWPVRTPDRETGRRRRFVGSSPAEAPLRLGAGRRLTERDPARRSRPPALLDAGTADSIVGGLASRARSLRAKAMTEAGAAPKRSSTRRALGISATP